MNPAEMEPAHLNGNFLVKYNMHVIPVHFKTDIHRKEFSSYQYSMAKKFKAISSDSLEMPDMTF